MQPNSCRGEGAPLSNSQPTPAMGHPWQMAQMLQCSSNCVLVLPFNFPALTTHRVAARMGILHDTQTHQVPLLWAQHGPSMREEQQSHTSGPIGTEKQEEQSLKNTLLNYILQQSFSLRIAKLEPVQQNCQPHSAPLQLLQS